MKGRRVRTEISVEMWRDFLGLHPPIGRVRRVARWIRRVPERLEGKLLDWLLTRSMRRLGL